MFLKAHWLFHCCCCCCCCCCCKIITVKDRVLTELTQWNRTRTVIQIKALTVLGCQPLYKCGLSLHASTTLIYLKFMCLFVLVLVLLFFLFFSSSFIIFLLLPLLLLLILLLFLLLLFLLLFLLVLLHHLFL